MMRMLITLVSILTGLLTGCSETPDEQARKYFLAGCMQGGTDKSLCDCSYSKLTEKYPAEFFLIEEPEMMDPEILKRFSMDVVKSAQLCQIGQR